jgi:hypothetical protein
MNDWDKILDDFARKCKGGAPDMTNPRHLALLRESLLKFGWNEFATNEFIGNLREGKEEDWWSKKSPAQQAQYIKNHPGSEKAQTAKDEKGEVKKKPNNHQGQNLESINLIDGDAKQGGLEHKIKAPGDPKGAAGTNEICQGIGVAAINELGEDATDEEIADKVCDEAGGTKLGDKFICPSDYDKQIQKMEKESKHRVEAIQTGEEMLALIEKKHGSKSENYIKAKKSLDDLKKEFKKRSKLDTARKNAIKTKKDYMKSIVNSARAKHRRNQEVIAEEGMNPESTTTSHVWGSKQSLTATVDSLSQHKPPITEVNDIPFKNDPAELYEGTFDKNNKFHATLDKNGQPIAKPVEFDKKTGKPKNYAQVILNGGEGDNPTDTMFVMVDDSKEPPKAVIVHDSDKMTSNDLQGNSGPKKTLDKGVEHFKKKWKDDTEQTEECGTGTKRACTKSERAEESANNTKRKIDDVKARIKKTISGQSVKFTKMTEKPRTKKKKKQMDNLLRLIREESPGGISSLTEYPKGSGETSGKYYNYLQKRYKDEIEEFKNNNPNASQEDIDYHMLEQYATEYEKVAKYADLTKEDFIDQKNRSKPNYKGDDKIKPTIPDPDDPTKMIPNPDYIPSDAKQPTEDMQKIAVRTMYREDEINPGGNKSKPILDETGGNSLKSLYDQQTTQLNIFRDEMNDIEDGAGDEFFVKDMIRRFHFGVSEGHSPGGVPANKFGLVMGRNESGIRYRTNKDGTTTIFRKVKGTKYVEIDENGDEVKGGETASTGKQGHGLEEGSTATVADEKNFKECLGVEPDDGLSLEETIEIRPLKAGKTNQAEAFIYWTNPKTGKSIAIARQTVRSKSGPGGSIADTIKFEPEFQNCLQLASHRNASKE